MKKLTTILFLITMLFVIVFNTIRAEAQIEPPDHSLVPTQTPTTQKTILRPQETKESQDGNDKKHKPTSTKTIPTATRVKPTPTEIIPTISPTETVSPVDTPSVFLLPSMKEKTKEEMRESRPHIFGD